MRFEKNSIEESNMSEEEKSDKLQELYADFDYPDDMSDCSIYSMRVADPVLKCMHNLIMSLKKKYNVNDTDSGHKSIL
jgi:hypothetical protein